MSSINDPIYVGYTPTDFFYVSATSNQLPTDASCNDPSSKYNLPYITRESCTVYSLDGVSNIDVADCYRPDATGNMPLYDTVYSCISKKLDPKGNANAEDIKKIFWRDNSMNCIRQEFCKNKQNAQKANSMENNHLGSDQNLSNVNTFYINEYVKTANYSVAVLLLTYYIYKK